MTDTTSRPFSTSSVISPYAALEAIAGTDNELSASSYSSPSHAHQNKSRMEDQHRPLTPLEDTLEESESDGPFLVRARFNFEATDHSALSFNAGDLIQVFARLESGWWDGMLDGQRGWFPSNYVEEIGEEDIKQIEQFQQLQQESNGGSQQQHTEEDVLRMDDVLRGGWGDWGGDTGLDQLAREMLAGDDDDALDDGRAFSEVARRKRAQVEGLMFSSEADEFGISSNRRREETDVTIRPSAASTHSSSTQHPPPTKGKQRESTQGASQDAWIPSITPDGQVYYHNTQTGEDLWELPMEGMGLEEDDTGFSQNDDDFFAKPSLTNDLSPTYQSTDNDFRPPPKASADIPYPWLAKLSDDGREWFYYNRLTGQSRKDLPTSKGDATSMTDIGVGMKRLSVGSNSRPLRASVELQRKAVEEWEKKTAEALKAVIQPEKKPTMGLLMDNVNESLREIFEASVAGSAAEEEMSRAEDLGSESGMIAAMMREENAVEMLSSAHKNTLAAIRQLLSSFGYVGPLDRMEELPRPSWVGDMTLIGSIGLLSANTHAAVTSKRIPETGLSIWAEVMRSASKVKDVIANFPNTALAGTIQPSGIDGAEGSRINAWLGFDVIGEPLNGKWGFGRTERNESELQVLEQNSVIQCQRLKNDFDTALRNITSTPENGLMDLIRLSTKFLEMMGSLDIASVIDVDGDSGDLGNGIRSREDDLREYEHLVDQARQAITDLDNSSKQITQTSIQLLYKIDSPLEGLRSIIELLSVGMTTAFRSLPTLLIISGEQIAAVDQGLIRGQIGIRSFKHHQSRRQSSITGRPISMISSTSRTSFSGAGSSSRRHKVRGLEEEFLDADDYGEMRDQPAQMPQTSASASTTSLAPQRSRTSSTTSLAYQQTESDSGSQKGNRTSILKAFRRNRADSDADGRGTQRNKTPSKKLAKLLGEDMSQLPINASVPPPAPPETPWYLLDDFVPGEIIFDDKGGVKAGSLRALVVRLTQHSSTDTPFFQAFLLTFRSFTNAHELFDHLVERYNISQPDGLNIEQSQEWKVKKQAPIRLRVANALRTWLERHYIEQTDNEVLDRMEEFANTTLLANGSELMSKQLLTLVGKRRQGEPEQTRGSASGSLLSPPAPLLPRVTGRQLRLTDVSPLEIARQLTIVEFIHFQRIKPSECLNRAWADENTGSINAPNVRNVILTANRMAGWVALHILSSKDVRQRATAMKILIQVAVECRNLNNFSSMAGIVAGLNSAPITRLKRTKELLSAKTQSMKSDLDKTLDSTKNFANYRDMLKTINPPCVPFFGFYLSALTFIEDGNKNFIQPGGPNSNIPGGPIKGLTNSNSSSPLSASNNFTKPLQSSTSSNSNSTTTNGTGHQQPLINFFKRALNAEILRDIAQYQSQPYNLARCKPVLEWIMRGLDEVEKGGDLYEVSQALEPREKEEERITRMLHDSVG
ncbi:hypothetical protein I302_107878 [Kwoniella bestiolae CBS 10118]|uniref:Cell division control protein 25 n=1 Tax=Kwoniella bestiolae CBS 10118 TaxID=1296100 RepID=A0A1B9FXA7_9TREE|nr:hypothetical protein I302_06380 [Kwoniella bestiolae CBS 10118]OCF23399.1 hypothetical protein I302_06380 [Kwoniella bestiolae CBS 10118]